MAKYTDRNIGRVIDAFEAPQPPNLGEQDPVSPRIGGRKGAYSTFAALQNISPAVSILGDFRAHGRDIQNLQEQFPKNLGDRRGPYFIRARGLVFLAGRHAISSQAAALKNIAQSSGFCWLRKRAISQETMGESTPCATIAPPIRRRHRQRLRLQSFDPT